MVIWFAARYQVFILFEVEQVYAVGKCYVALVLWQKEVVVNLMVKTLEKDIIIRLQHSNLAESLVRFMLTIGM